MNELNNKLSDKEYWNSIYAQDKRDEETNMYSDSFLITALKRIKKKLERIQILNFFTQNYSTNFLWNKIYAKYLPVNSEYKFLELGSAPGKVPIQMNKNFGYVPFGLEYTDSGVRVNRNFFVSNGFSPDNVIHDDMFSVDFLENNKKKFNVVNSNGLIEHFDNVLEVIDIHLELLKEDGYLVITIPNFKGFNEKLSKFLFPTFMDIHNQSIMDEKKFAELFEKKKLDKKFCGYVGTFNMVLQTVGPSRVKKFIFFNLLILHFLVINPLLYIFCRNGFESPSFSPYLVYIGKKIK